MTTSAEDAILSNVLCMITCRYSLDEVHVAAPDSAILESNSALDGPGAPAGPPQSQWGRGRFVYESPSAVKKASTRTASVAAQSSFVMNLD